MLIKSKQRVIFSSKLGFDDSLATQSARIKQTCNYLTCNVFKKGPKDTLAVLLYHAMCVASNVKIYNCLYSTLIRYNYFL